MRTIQNLKKNTSGAALTVAVVVMMILTMLALSLLLLSYALFATSGQRYDKAQSRELSKTLAASISDELKASYVSYEAQQEGMQAGEHPLWFYLRCNIRQDSWPYYNSEESGHGGEEAFRYFQLDALEGSGAYDSWDEIADEISVRMYWETEENSSLDERDIPVKLTVQVTCQVGSETDTVSESYDLDISYYSEGMEDLEAADTITDANLNPDGNTIKKYEKWKWSREE